MSASPSLSAENSSDNVGKTMVGRVVGSAMNKTAVVAIVRKAAHPVYGKYVKKTTKFYVHDEDNKLNVGDLVKIAASKPISKLKRWVLTEVIETANS